MSALEAIKFRCTEKVSQEEVNCGTWNGTKVLIRDKCGVWERQEDSW